MTLLGTPRSEFDSSAGPVDVSVLGAPRLLAGVTGGGRLDHTRHLAVHGPATIRRRTWLSMALHESNLLGRGGAAFPLALKLDAMPSGSGSAVLVNGSEGEPASRKDRTLMTYAPHLVLDGALVAAHALDTRRITIAVHDADAHDSLAAARSERPDAHDINLVHTHDGFVGGEVRAVINGLNGGPAVPGGRRVLPHTGGLEKRPTLASNVETFAQLALLARLGVADYTGVGSTDEPGTTLLTLHGDALRPGVVEVPHGIPLSMLFPAGGGPVLIGGYHGTWVSSLDDLVLDRAALSARGAPLGAGVIARPPAGTCLVAEVVAVARWLASESTGQCGPCYFGLPALADDLAAIASGAGPERAASAHRRLALVRGRGACAHPDGSAQLIGSALDVLGPELDQHSRHGTCGLPVSRTLPLPTTNQQDSTSQERMS